MKIAKASPREVDALADWFNDQEDKGVPVPHWRRVVAGYEVLVDNCADPKADTLDFSPKLKAAMEDAKRLDWMEARGMRWLSGDAVTRAQIDAMMQAHPKP